MNRNHEYLTHYLRKCFLASSLVLIAGIGGSAHAGHYPVPRLFQGTNTAIARVGFSPTVIALGTEKRVIESLHILERPYRPLHFYGNSVRRRHYRQR